MFKPFWVNLEISLKMSLHQRILPLVIRFNSIDSHIDAGLLWESVHTRQLIDLDRFQFGFEKVFTLVQIDLM